MAVGIPAMISAGCKKEDPLPNIVFILTYDPGYTQLGCDGSRYYQTPNIDNRPRKACVLLMLSAQIQSIKAIPQTKS